MCHQNPACDKSILTVQGNKAHDFCDFIWYWFSLYVACLAVGKLWCACACVSVSILLELSFLFWLTAMIWWNYKLEFLSSTITFVLSGNSLIMGGNKEHSTYKPGYSIFAFQMISHSITSPLFKSQTSDTKKIMGWGHQESL